MTTGFSMIYITLSRHFSHISKVFLNHLPLEVVAARFKHPMAAPATLLLFGCHRAAAWTAVQFDREFAALRAANTIAIDKRVTVFAVPRIIDLQRWTLDIHSPFP